MTWWRVRIRGGGSIWGAGVLVGDRTVLTCAHVVNQALGRRAHESALPTDAVEVDFPAIRGADRMAASVAPDLWTPVDEDGCGDIAVLTLADDPPNAVVPARLSDDPCRATAVHVVGHPRGHDDGIEAQARTAGSGGPGGEWTQLDAERVTGYRIQQGFSGAGVVDSATGAVVGIVVSEANDAVAKVAWMIPMTVIAARLPNLDLDLDRHTSGSAPAVNTLPPAVGDFVGREREIEQLRHAILGVADPIVPVILGMGGIGKTTLATQLTHGLARNYPDAQLFIDLQGYTEGAQPLETGVALARLLRMLGVVPKPAPDSDAEWAERWRAELARCRVVVVLDNAVSGEQVRHLLPGTTRSLALVTSRRRLTGVENVAEFPLDVLPQQDAHTLFARIVGKERAEREPAGVAEILTLSGRLPLAVRLVAARLRAHPSWDIANMVDDITDEHGKLTELNRDDDTEPANARLSVRAAFGLSYRDLGNEEKRLFRRLGLHPSAEFTSHAAVALDGSDLRSGRRVLERLVDYSLLRELNRDRFRFHDLVHEYAREREAAEEAPDERRAAVDQLLGYYLHCALTAHATLWPHRVVDDTVGSPPAVAPDLTQPNSARNWLAMEQANLVACTTMADEHDLPDYLWRIPRAMGNHFVLRAGAKDATVVFTTGRAAALRAGDDAGIADMTAYLAEVSHVAGKSRAARSEASQARTRYLRLGKNLAAADMSNHIGRSLRMMGQFDEAREHHQQALDDFRDLDDRYGRAESHFYLGMIDRLAGDYQAALSNQERAVALYRELSDEIGEARCVEAIGILHRLRGDYRAAVGCFDRALDAYQRNGDRRGIAHTLNNTASSLLLLGDLDGARSRVTGAIDIFRAVGNRSGEADAWVVSGRISRAMGAFIDSREHLSLSLTMATELSSQGGQANASLELSKTLRAAGAPADAIEHGERALRIYGVLSSLRGTAIAELELAQCLHAIRDPAARTHGERALAACERHGLPEAAEARELLAAIDLGD